MQAEPPTCNSAESELINQALIGKPWLLFSAIRTEVFYMARFGLSESKYVWLMYMCVYVSFPLGHQTTEFQRNPDTPQLQESVFMYVKQL